MPDTLAGLLIFVVLAAPGLAFNARRRAYKPTAARSLFTETASIVVTSFVAIGTVLLGFFAVEAWTDLTPDLDTLVADPGKAFRGGYRQWLGWGVALFGLATALAWLTARFLYRGGTAARLYELSMWDRILYDLDQEESGYAFVDVGLVDGSKLSGYLKEFDARLEAEEDRDLILSWPLTHTHDGRHETLDAEYVTINARRINFIAVQYGVDHPAD